MLLHENSYKTKEGKVLLVPTKTINDLLIILQIIKDKNIEIKGRDTNGVLALQKCNQNKAYWQLLNLYDREEIIIKENEKRKYFKDHKWLKY
ncbi:hypothetical protein [Gemella morbillorum]